ncbi:MAG: type II toxin-antitoxin system RelE/ParE family toxin [Spirochaetes bacterium]|jgi:plasmid stabilization system protein ParE|nr:type II toxin-antitoxin system RelE/ParE family toxin [Spirochaetota bacterium]
MRRIVWAASAAEDLREVVAWLLDRDALDAARSLLAKVDEEIRRLEQFSQSGQVVPELAREDITRYREAVIDSRRVLCTVTAESITVLAFIYSRRNMEDILLYRGIR